MRDAKLDAWLTDRLIESLRAGLSRVERELMAFRVRKLPCDDDEERSPRTAAQEATRLPRKMPHKTVGESVEEVAFRKIINDDVMRQMRITDSNYRAKFLVDMAAGDIVKYSPISGVTER